MLRDAQQLATIEFRKRLRTSAAGFVIILNNVDRHCDEDSHRK